MSFLINFKVNPSIYLKDPESSDLGKNLLKTSIKLIYELGLELFTFKKLAAEMGTTEATIYRYFENKHRLLLYIINWYWSYMEYLVEFKLQNVNSKKEKIKIIIELLTNEPPPDHHISGFNYKQLYEIIISESSKVYIIKDVAEINKDEVYKPFKDLCARIAQVIKDYNSRYQYPNSLASTILETAHDQKFFSKNLPRLTDVAKKASDNYSNSFLQDLVFKTLD
jgi:AcrR family transcriptional regulator